MVYSSKKVKEYFLSSDPEACPMIEEIQFLDENGKPENQNIVSFDVKT